MVNYTRNLQCDVDLSPTACSICKSILRHVDLLRTRCKKKVPSTNCRFEHFSVSAPQPSCKCNANNQQNERKSVQKYANERKFNKGDLMIVFPPADFEETYENFGEDLNLNLGTIKKASCSNKKT